MKMRHSGEQMPAYAFLNGLKCIRRRIWQAEGAGFLAWLGTTAGGACFIFAEGLAKFRNNE